MGYKQRYMSWQRPVGSGAERAVVLSLDLFGLFVFGLHTREDVNVGLRWVLRIGWARWIWGADVGGAGEVLLRQAGLASRAA